jgi:hypothetical protein
MSETNTTVSSAPPPFDRVLELARQLDLTERARLVAQLAADVELSLTQQATPPSPTAEERTRRIRALQQNYGHLLSSSDAFARRKQEEIDREMW